MKRAAMLAMGHRGCHDCAPRSWRTIPKLTGDYDLDATILHRDNKDLPHRLALHLSGPNYRQVTAYRGYKNYHGDS